MATMTTTTAATSITILSTSSASARRAIKILADWVSLKDATTTTTSRFHHVIPWSLLTTKCVDNDVQIQWIAPDYDNTSGAFLGSTLSEPPPRHSLVAITRAASSDINHDDPASALAPFEDTLSRTKLKACHFFRRPVHASYLLGSASRSMPLLQLQVQAQQQEHLDSGALTLPPIRSGLKEVVIPYDDEAIDNTTMRPFEQLSSLSSPATGLYLLPNSNLCVRPLPTGFHDRQLPPPSLVFHSSKALEWPVESRDNSVTIRKIGHSGGVSSRGSSASSNSAACRSSSGVGGGGQYRFDSVDLAGLDVRLCSSDAYQSMFAEAHESLLAGSIDKLQSTRVLGVQDIDDHDENEEDRRKSNSDCWMEFRATIRSPVGFFRRPASKGRVAKVPDLPYE